MDNGFFGDLFDFDSNGELDDFERAYDYAAFHELMEETEKAEAKDAGLDPYDFGDD